MKVDLSSVRLDERGRGESGIVNFIFGFIIAFMLYMMIMLYGQNVMRGVLEEKMTRVAEVVMDDNLVKQLRTGTSATYIIFQTPEEGIGIPLSLKGFGEGYDKLP